MIRKIEILGRKFEVECDEESVGRLLLSTDALEKRMSEFFNGDVSDTTSYTHALVLTALKIEWKLHNVRVEKQANADSQKIIDDLKAQNEILNKTIEQMANDRTKNIEKIHEIEKEIDDLVRLLRGRENNSESS